jgi:hypothetical protein
MAEQHIARVHQLRQSVWLDNLSRRQGIPLDRVTAQLEAEGIQAFAESYRQVQAAFAVYGVGS